MFFTIPASASRRVHPGASFSSSSRMMRRDKPGGSLFIFLE
jgi:hypothetical protein